MMDSETDIIDLYLKPDGHCHRCGEGAGHGKLFCSGWCEFLFRYRPRIPAKIYEKKPGYNEIMKNIEYIAPELFNNESYFKSNNNAGEDDSELPESY